MEYIESSKTKNVSRSIVSIRLTPLILLTLRLVVISMCLTLASRGGSIDLLPIISYSILLCFGAYQVISALLYLEVVKYGLCRLLLGSADAIITLTVIYITGGLNSPYLASLIIPVVTVLYKQHN